MSDFGVDKNVGPKTSEGLRRSEIVKNAFNGNVTDEEIKEWENAFLNWLDSEGDI